MDLIKAGDDNTLVLGDASRYNPEELMLASLSACHMLWYLHLCSMSKVVVTDYEDHPEGMMEVAADGSGRFTQATLKPQVTITAESNKVKAESLHALASAKCFIANSVNFPVHHEAVVTRG